MVPWFPNDPGVKRALSQASVYLVHNATQPRLENFDEQLSFGTDKRLIKKILNGIASARKGECVAYAPEFFRDRGYLVIDKTVATVKPNTQETVDVRSTLGGVSLDEDEETEPFEAVSSVPS